MPLKIELLNIGGLRGKHEFNFKEGLNLLQAPNATGKSSLLKSIFLIIGNESISKSELDGFLTDNEVSGYVRLVDEKGKKSEVKLIRDISKGIQLTKTDIQPEFITDLFYDLIFLRENSKINQSIQTANDIMIENWFLDITNVNIFHTVFVKSQEILHNIEDKLDDLKQKQNQDIKPIKDLVNEKKDILIKNQKRKQEIISDPKIKKSERLSKELPKEIKQLEETKKKLNNEILEIKNHTRPKLLKDYEELDEEIKNLDNELKNIESEREILQIERKEWEDKLLKKDNKITKVKNEIKNLANDKREKSYNIDRLGKLKDRSICPLCESDIDKIKNAQMLNDNEKELKSILEKELKLERSKKTTENEKKIAQNKVKELEHTIKYLPEEISNNIDKFMKQFQEVDKSVKKLKESEDKLEEELKETEKSIFEKEEELKKNLNPELKKEIDKLNNSITDLNLEITRLELKINEYMENNLELLKAEKRYFVAEKITDYYQNRVERIRKEMVRNINNNLEEYFKLLELAELQRITLDPEHFKLDIQRIDKSYTNLKKMSAAERALISIIISFIVKQTIIPEIPIFLIDEVTSEMDDTRFKDILNFLSNEIPYLIVARHSPFNRTKQLLTSQEIINII